MLRFYLTIIFNLYRIPYYMIKMLYYINNPEKYSEEQRYSLACKIAYMIQHSSRIKTISSGQEKLPQKGGYIMYPNHQGRYDMLGIVTEHSSPCSFIMDDKRSHMPITSQICDLMEAKRMVKSDLKQSLQIILDVADEVKVGKRYVIFPEGSYEHDHSDNKLGEFKPGCFKAAIKAKVPIVPVALIDSYKPYEGNSFRKVITETHFLNPIPYDEYKGMNTREISDLVKLRIQEAIQNITASKNE